MSKMRLITSWTEDISEEVKYRLENWREFGQYETEPTEQEVVRDIMEDQDYWAQEWELLADYLGEVMKEKNPHGRHWRVEMKNFGWRGLSGDKIFVAKTGQEFLNNILPKTDCHFKIYHWGKNGFAINNAHHDSPMWAEWYYIKPLTNKEENELNEY